MRTMAIRRAKTKLVLCLAHQKTTLRASTEARTTTDLGANKGTPTSNWATLCRNTLHIAPTRRQGPSSEPQERPSTAGEAECPREFFPGKSGFTSVTPPENRSESRPTPAPSAGQHEGPNPTSCVGTAPHGLSLGWSAKAERNLSDL